MFCAGYEFFKKYSLSCVNFGIMLGLTVLWVSPTGQLNRPPVGPPSPDSEFPGAQPSLVNELSPGFARSYPQIIQ